MNNRLSKSSFFTCSLKYFFSKARFWLLFKTFSKNIYHSLSVPVFSATSRQTKLSALSSCRSSTTSRRTIVSISTISNVKSRLNFTLPRFESNVYTPLKSIEGLVLTSKDCSVGCSRYCEQYQITVRSVTTVFGTCPNVLTDCGRVPLFKSLYLGPIQ